MTQSRDREDRRALVLAGGGLKVAFQAGVLQVWLDEARINDARLAFHTADGASGGVFNLALWCQGLSGRQIADKWRAHRPLRGASPNLGLPFHPSLLSSKGMRTRVIPKLGIDVGRVRQGVDGRLNATFNVWDVTEQVVVTKPREEITSDLVLAAVSPPLWFPPVRTAGSTYTDAVFATDGNLLAPIRNGANDLWVIWTVSTAGRWRPGWARGYFQTLETAANARLKADLERIAASNALGGGGEFPEPITVRLLAAEVPVDYLLTFRRAQMAKAVDLGVRKARKWCAEQGIGVEPPPPGDPDAADDGGILFRETLRGGLVLGAADPRNLPDGPALDLTLQLVVSVPEVGSFVEDENHPASVAGYVRCPQWPGPREISQGTVNVFEEIAGGGRKMRYDLHFTDPDGRPLQLQGLKYVYNGGVFTSWTETTSLFATLTDVAAEEPLVGSGVLRVSPLGFLHELGTFRGIAPTAIGRLRAVARYGGFFFGQLNDVRKERRWPARPIPRWLTELVDVS